MVSKSKSTYSIIKILKIGVKKIKKEKRNNGIME
jgi:DNA-binding CsgD family transcriptional regulator